MLIAGFVVDLDAPMHEFMPFLAVLRSCTARADGKYQRAQRSRPLPCSHHGVCLFPSLLSSLSPVPCLSTPDDFWRDQLDVRMIVMCLLLQAASRHQCKYLVTLLTEQYLANGGSAEVSHACITCTRSSLADMHACIHV